MTPDEQYLREVMRRRERSLAMIARIPVAVLIWGPSPSASSPLAVTRREIQRSLRSRGHIAHFSEELFDPALSYSVVAQQVADIEAHDLVLSLPGSAGSLSEIHDFFSMPGISRKIITFLDRQSNDGYANRSLIELRSQATSDIVLYDEAQLPQCIITPVLDMVRRLQEIHFLHGRRA